ncbi:Lymphocyte cytosolic protein 2 [Geodia barretti]|uniref:Lymphocyte cytosolic protein 2 n=1 Tax=Geodia barretti TaxID=519541 RepID=A0AA35RGQ4_GEOBA|nr:Lymphocyte cytosolic protein 2 [Geodia barretti]
MKGSGVPVPGKFLGRSALRPVGTKTDGEPKPVVSDKPMSIQERIKLLKKPGGEGGEGRKGQPPPKPAEGVSPCTRRKMSKDSSVSDLIKSYHSGGSSTDGEKSRPMSPETKPALPVKPPALSPKHGERSPQPKRHPTTQQIPPGLPEKRSGQPPWKKTASEEQEEQEPPKKTRQTVSKEEGQRPWQRRTSAEEATEHRPPWRKTGGEETVDVRPPWRKTGGEETVDVRPPWRKTGGEETADVRPPWRKNEEVSESRPPWRKPSVEEESQPSWKRPAAESPPQEGVVRSSFTHQEPFRASKSPAKPDLPPPRRTDNASPPDLPPPRRTDNASHPDLPPPRRTDNASPPDLPPPRRTDNASPPDLPPPRRTDNASPPDLPPPRHKEIAPPPPEPPRASDKLKSRFPAPDNAPSEPPGRGKSDKALPTEPPRPPLPVERSRFRAPDGPAPSVPKPSVVQEDAPPEVPKMTFLTNNRLRGRVLPTQEEEMPRLPPRPRKLPDRPLPTHGSDPGPGLPQRPWQRPPIASHTVEPGPSSSSGSPLGHSWYHANLKDRKVAEARLFKHPRDGTFIIRDSSRTAGEYSLSLLYHGAVKHLRIRLRGDGQYVLGEEKADEVPFASVVELVNYHKEEPLVLKSGGNVMLRYECPH